MNSPATTDLSDAYSDDAAANLRYLAPGYHDYGGLTAFHGQVVTLASFEDNTKLRAQVETAGHGRVLVVDGGGSHRCALLGGNLAQLAAQNGWAGIVIHGCVRDREEIAAEAVGVKALNTHPKKSVKRDLGELNVAVTFSGVTIHPDDWLYADGDGVLISAKELKF